MRDGYWQDNDYIVGQEQDLYNDGLETIRIMSRPKAKYDISIYNDNDAVFAPFKVAKVNDPVHIIDVDAGLNTWGFVDKVNYAIDTPYKTDMSHSTSGTHPTSPSYSTTISQSALQSGTSVFVSTDEARFTGKTLPNLFTSIADVAAYVRESGDIRTRTMNLTNSGKLAAEALEGIINVEMNRLLSTTSNWETDERGNIVFVSQDGTAAMMLTGEGFMIANGKRSDGRWNWRTMGTGRGLT